MPSLCSLEASVICDIIDVTPCIELTISPIVSPACVTNLLPPFTRITESSIKFLISPAAVAARCAKFLTSTATTAKPLPWSPARAASTAAFNAKMLV